MTGVDIVIIGFAVLFGIVGFARGFFIGALSLGGFIAGAWLGTRFGPLLLPDGNRSPYAPLFGLFGAIVAGTIISAGAEGIAGRMRAGMSGSGGFGILDGMLGAALGIALALGFAWVVGVIVLQTPGVRDLRKTVQRSAILEELNDVLPSDTLLKALARFDPFPRVDGPEVNVGRPDAQAARDPDVQRAGDSVVKILGNACGLGVTGSGWVAGDGTVVTNAHVVAGQDETFVEPRGGGARREATVVAFNVKNDIAVLRVSDLGLPALSFAREVKVGEPGAVAGYPLSGPFAIRAARIGQTRVVISQDAYGRGPVRRRITAFRGNVQPGNSGGPIIDVAGRVSATVFAESIGGANRGGYAVANEVVRRVLATADGAVDTGPCVS
jgi:S1-C subfamily serine protease